MVEDWSNRKLSEVYPIVFIDAIHFSVRKDKIVQKLASYVVLGINSDGMKEVLSIEIGETESSRFWLSVLNSLKNRGVKDILILCSDGLSGLKEAVATSFPDTEHQRCLVHMVRNTLKHVSHKDKKEYATDLKTIYHAADEETAFLNFEEVKEKWDKVYKNSMKEWEINWNLISPIFKYPMNVRKVFYTTNAIESLNSEYRRINRARSVFPNEDALKKALYLATMKISKKWTMKIKDFGKIIGQLEIFFEGRI